MALSKCHTLFWAFCRNCFPLVISLQGESRTGMPVNLFLIWYHCDLCLPSPSAQIGFYWLITSRTFWNLAYLVTWVRVLKSSDRIDFNTSMQPMYCKDRNILYYMIDFQPDVLFYRSFFSFQLKHFRSWDWNCHNSLFQWYTVLRQ